MLNRFIAASVFVVAGALCPVAHAEQFVLVDVEYTHSTDTTRDSHYYPDLPADMPKDWTKPIDWSKGSVHIVMDVKTKPAGDAPTKLQICFEATPSYACTVQSPTYRKAGRVEWDSPFSAFWYESTVDWSKGIKESPLILKDDMNNKPHGNAMYMPTDLHVQVTLVSPGSTFVPPPAAGSGGTGGAAGAATGGAGAAAMAGAGGSGGAGTGVSGNAGAGGVAGSAGRAGAAGTGAGAAAGGGSAGRAGSSASGGAGATAGRAGSSASAGSSSPGASGSNAAAGSAAPSGAAGSVGSMMGAQEAAGEDDGGCRLSGGANHSSWLVGLALLFLASRRRRPRSAGRDDRARR